MKVVLSFFSFLLYNQTTHAEKFERCCKLGRSHLGYVYINFGLTEKLRNIDGPRTVPEHFEVNFTKGSFRMSTKLEKKFKERANTLDLTRTGTDSPMFDGETNYTLLILRAC